MQAMGAVSAIRTKRGVNAIPLLIKMMTAQVHRGDDVFGVATPRESLFTGHLTDLDEMQSTNTAIAYNLMRVVPGDLPQPRLYRDRYIIIESDYLESVASFNELMNYLSTETPDRSLTRLVSEFDGQYTIVILKDKELAAARDPVGLKPLYYCSNNDLAALSTEKKGLWSLGAKNARTFPPGHVWRLSASESPHPIRQITPQRVIQREVKETSQLLGSLLRKSVAERALGLGKVGISFSGGVDSSITAHLLSRLELDLYAFVVGVRSHPALDWALEAAELLGVKVKTQEHAPEDVEKTLRRCVWRVEEANPVKLGIAIPLCWSANLANKSGVSTVFTGQGADELFAGYHRFLRVMREGGESSLRNAVFESVRDAHEASYHAGEQATEPERVRMLHPFTDWELIGFGLSIPPSLKIQSPDDGLRKRILRRACVDLGLPKQLADVPKKAMQYSTGVDNCIRALAKNRGLATKVYLSHMFEESFHSFHAEHPDQRKNCQST